MLVGFIAVVVILLVIIGVMATGSGDKRDGGRYATEAKKVQAMLSNLESEAKFYYAKDETFNGLSMEYFKDIKFAEGKLIKPEDANHTDMAAVDWDGWPAEGLNDPYQGSYIKLGGPASDQMRIVVVPLNDGKAFGVYILKKKENTVDPAYTKVLERSLAQDSAYVGG